MTKAKAEKKLRWAIEDREYWREAYVKNERAASGNLDTYISYIGGTIRETRRAEAIERIKAANDRIARFERIVK